MSLHDRAQMWLNLWYTPVDYQDTPLARRFALYMNTMTLIECNRIIDGRKV